MIPSHVAKAEKLKKEIDKALFELVNIPDAYIPFDFYGKLESLLTITKVKEEMQLEIEKFYSVMMDLYSSVGTCYHRLAEVDMKSLQLAYKESYQFSNQYYLESFDNTYIYSATREGLEKDKELHERMMVPVVAYDPLLYKMVTKYRYLLNKSDHTKYWIFVLNDDQRAKEKLNDLFVRFGYSLDNIQVSFEGYIKDLDESSDKGQINSTDFLTHRQQMLLLSEINFFDLPAMKKMPDTKRAILLSGLLNRSEPNTRNYLGKMHDASIIRTDLNLEKVNSLLKEAGITKNNKKL